MTESNEQLQARYERVKEDVDRRHQQLERLKPGSPSRTKKARLCGCIRFTLLQIESELRERGLMS